MHHEVRLQPAMIKQCIESLLERERVSTDKYDINLYRP